MSNQHRVTDELIHNITTEIPCAEKSVYRRALGLPVRGRIAGRIDKALEAAGLAPPPSTTPPSAG